jgi:hypothetical protein
MVCIVCVCVRFKREYYESESDVEFNLITVVHNIHYARQPLAWFSVSSLDPL